ncbi:PEGA domain-containing protein [Pontiella agarivorans]|uniref:PEGA domain-containing protein n=1 Tax=Pontiella agarivorans TaxID=3038953 RepID=A0ABU5MSV7_9BACT|nr:PEGA domain-containing protein [Pontiella agarivorans]MDZ8117221.1 PEGA domain-containing protein [Pontiella agarivorans]
MNRKTAVKVSFAVGALLSLLLSGCAPVTLSSEPSGAYVYNKGHEETALGMTPFKVNLVANQKELIVRKNGYFSKTVVISPTDPESINVELQRRDKVLLRSNPDGAELYVDGRRVGRTPYRVDYKKAWRTFEVRSAGYASQICTIPEDPEGDVMVDLERDNSLMITSKPRNAAVFTEEGDFLGRTPLGVPAGDTLILEVRKEGYYSTSFTVDEETAGPFVVELEREPIVIVYSEPEGALVKHRGVTLGVTPFRRLVENDMDIELVYNRYKTAEITIAPDSPREVRVELEKEPYVTINSNPAGAMLYRSGGVELIGTTPVEVLMSKDTAFEMHKPGYDIKSFTLSPQSKSEVTVPLKQTVGNQEKIVKIDSTPSGAKVYRPGGAEFIGTTPLEQPVRGERTFELQLDGFETKIVTVAPDSADNVTFALARDESARNVTVSDPLLNTPSSF